ncbi:LysR family transcriptional regulator [Luteibacter sp. ME-Dv--P-043b]|uniref:LysR family transcriptional regulator n=1 Tax=Luteibacter sp. ME-Dv--P-043b TaxID=3040291 RepID=UPI0025538701|nr:LysR family transcriptional regulator [Luteibacter sp. ME-Dv--P-043b]
MDRLLAMQVFVRVAERGSFSAAARAMGISQPSASQQVAALEAELGARLIHRTTRRLTLTDAGSRYLEQATVVLDALAAADAAVKDDPKQLHGRLRIQAPSGIGQQLVAPLLMAFQAEHPDVRVELALDDRIADVVAEGVDLAIRLGPLPPNGLVARHIGQVERALVASPDYLARHGTPRTPDQLRLHPHIRFSGSVDHPLMLTGPDGPVTLAVSPGFVANNSFVLIAALVAGRGIGGVQLPLVRDELACGTLVRVLDGFAYPPLDMHLVLPTRRHVPSIVRAFMTRVEAAADAACRAGA